MRSNCPPARISHRLAMLAATAAALMPSAVSAQEPSSLPGAHFRAAEARIVVDLTGFVGFTNCVGNLTLYEQNGRAGWASERPLDAIHVQGGRALPGDSDISAICDGEGSELRFMGKRSAGAMTVTTEPGVRLCFRKTQEGWVYLSGPGTVAYDWTKLLHGLVKTDPAADSHAPKTVKLGYDRTADSCVRALSSDDPLIREGNVRDLGRLAAGQDAPELTARIAELLKDEEPAVRCGAAEALGSLGTRSAFTALREAADMAGEKRTKPFLAEALAIYGGVALFDPRSLPGIDAEQAARLYNAGNTGWADRVLIHRMRAAGDIVHPLSQLLGSANPMIRAAAVELLGLDATVDGRRPAAEAKDIRKLLEPLKKDGDPNVRAALRKADLRIGNKDMLLDGMPGTI